TPAAPAVVRSPGAAALAQAFDSSDSATSLEPSGFDDDPATRAEPVAHKRQSRMQLPLDPASTLPSAPTPAMLDAARPTGPIVANAAVTAPMLPTSDGTADDDENLEIGEVSRVVKLADLTRTPKPVGRATGAQARLRGT